MVPWLTICLSMQETPVPSLVKELRSLMDFPGGSDSKVSVYNVGDLGSIPGSERTPGEGNGNPLQCSCLENPGDRGAWWAAVYGLHRVGHN